jgi:hypothetical protein
VKGWTIYLLPGIAALLLLLYYLMLGPSASVSDSTEAPAKAPLPGANAPPRRPVADAAPSE